MHPWAWLTTGQNATAIAAIASSFTVPALIATLVYSNRTVREAGRQAKAAEHAANMSIKQLALGAQSEDRATQPLLRVQITQGEFSAIIENVGLGPAYAIKVVFANQLDTPIYCRNDVLGVGQKVEFQCNPKLLGLLGLQISYQSIHERRHVTTARLSAKTLDWEENHEFFPARIDDLWDVTFDSKE